MTPRDPAALDTALRRAGADPHPLDPADLPAAAHGLAALLWIHDGPAPRAWTGLDTLPEHGTACLRVSREGRHALLEPLTAAPGDPTHAHVRARRLAAAGSGHRHQSAYWADPAPLTGHEALDAADLALVTALAVADLRAWATGAPAPAGDLTPRALPATRRLRVLALDSGAVHDHPLLPVPPSAP
ncbi:MULTISPECIES: hypothetical protein [unclassified Nocardiopsis]|uniref:hypothetical protein n=1 Tax=unclassified Nocardiopsis TaxID=2649073 RepID=UPI0019161626|nr:MULTISPECIES: hypothetical protein [unclassified Nocardiopsis]